MPWSPSSVNDFLACPRMWKLKRLAVAGRQQETEGQDAGTQYHALMATFWGGSTAVPLTVPSFVIRAVSQTMDQEGEALEEEGIVGVEVNLDGDDAEAARHGRYPGTCDLITDNGVGLTITDYKTKMKLDDLYVDRELRETKRSWQLKQYAWFAQQKFGRPVTHVRKLLVRFAPLRVWLYSHELGETELLEWYKQAQEVWALMDSHEGLVSIDGTWQNDDTCERFGWQWRCQYFERCWEGA